MTTKAADHRHDFGITISVAGLDPEMYERTLLFLKVQVRQMVDRVNAETTGFAASMDVTYDGQRECGEH